MLFEKRSGVFALAALVAACSAPATLALETDSLLMAPTERLTNVLPQRVLEDLEVPPLPEPAPEPVRVAQRPKLQWRPAVVKPDPAEKSDASPSMTPSKPPRASEPKSEDPAPKAPQAKAPEATDPAADSDPALLKPVDTPPMLVAPNAKRAEAEPSEPAEPQAIEPAPATKLPLRKPRQINPPAQKKETTPEPSAPKAPETAKPTPKSDQRAAEPKSQPQQKPQPKKVASAPAAPPKPLSRSLRNLRGQLRSVLSFYYRQPLNTVEHDPWELMHAMLAYELHSRVRDGGPQGQYMTAVGHLCFNRPSSRQKMMTLDSNGRIDVQIGVGLQGHKGQLLAMLAQCNVSPEYPIRVDGREFTIHDLIEAEKLSCESNTELTFKLIGLGHYLDSDATWLNDQGETWSIPRLIKEEREQPIRGAACGGTHRLAGLSLAFRRREARDEPVDGEYAEAARFVSEYQAYAFRLQNEDGSMSTEWFRGPGEEEDIDRRLRTSGHLLEWLVYSLEDEQLRSYRTIRAVNYVTQLLAKNADHEWHLGSIAHAIHALVLYDKRVFRPHDQQQQIVGAVDPTGRLFRGYPIYRGVMRNSPPEPTGFFGLFGGSRTGSAARNRR